MSTASPARTDDAVPLGDLNVREFVTRLGSSDPTPDGGAAAALLGAVVAGLVAMVADLSTGRPKLDPCAATIRRSGAIGRRFGAELLALADRDAVAFETFMAVWRRREEAVSPERKTALSDAARASAAVPLSILGACVVVAEAAERLAGRSNPNLASDLVCASRAVEAAAHCAAENVLVNLPCLADAHEAEVLRTEAQWMVVARHLIESGAGATELAAAVWSAASRAYPTSGSSIPTSCRCATRSRRSRSGFMAPTGSTSARPPTRRSRRTRRSASGICRCAWRRPSTASVTIPRCSADQATSGCRSVRSALPPAPASSRRSRATCGRCPGSIHDPAASGSTSTSAATSWALF